LKKKSQNFWISRE